ncbi:venom serine carboxypeptidase [Nilaparvata lugens]|uniref:venom serine carboxypeptidase n=1 Tax=Nilaparvata lugens TaxID=108931 RepID=UPI00193D5AFF|nr:venom serine carboxypeptidase [Nilaparvata lugens]
MLKLGGISIVVLVILVFQIFSVSGYVYKTPHLKRTKFRRDGSLFLTPLIENRNIPLARQLSKVASFVPDVNVDSYAGYLTVNKTYNSNLFFWFFKSQTNWKESPVAVWLQGGPGYSGLYGLFNELGPYEIREDGLVSREYSWNRECNLIFIDSPVGTGYSFTKSIQGFARNQEDVGNDLYVAMVQILQMFPEIQNAPFYITGESYAGKYIPALGYAIHKNNPKSSLKINLQGLFIGNGLTDPENMIPMYGEVLYNLGFIDFNQRNEFENLQNLAVEAIRGEKWVDAAIYYAKLIIGYRFYPYPTLYTNLTGLETYYNYFAENSAKWLEFEEEFVRSAAFRGAVHVGDVARDDGRNTELFLMEDIAKSVIGWVEELVEHYKVVFYNGQLDLICAYPLTENFLRKMEWSGAEKYRNCSRRQWVVDGELAGYVRTVGNLSDVLVRNAGHMVPTDQPKWAYQLFNNFVHDRDW